MVETLCNDGFMAKTVIVKLTDDIDGDDADETVPFALDGRSYEIDMSTKNAARLREALEPELSKARESRWSGSPIRSDRDDVLAAEGRCEGSLPCLGRHGNGSPDQRCRE